MRGMTTKGIKGMISQGDERIGQDTEQFLSTSVGFDSLSCFSGKPDKVKTRKYLCQKQTKAKGLGSSDSNAGM